MNKIFFSLFLIPFILTNAYASEQVTENYCPSTHIAVNGQCQSANYINPLYWVFLIALIPVTLIIIFVFKSKIPKVKHLDQSN